MAKRSGQGTNSSGVVVKTGARVGVRFKCGVMGEEGLRRLEDGLRGYLGRVTDIRVEGGTAEEWGKLVRGGEELEKRIEGAIAGIGPFLVEIGKWHSGSGWKMPAAEVKERVEGKRGRRAPVLRRGLGESFDTSGGEDA